jgi:clan AA aspartic protease
MIPGNVSGENEAVIRLAVRGPQVAEHTTEAVIDTGFSGWLSLPSTVIAHLGLPWLQRSQAILAVGEVAQMEIYEGFVVWAGIPRRVFVHQAESMPLVGMSLLAEHELRVEVRPGGSVGICPLR